MRLGKLVPTDKKIDKIFINCALPLVEEFFLINELHDIFPQAQISILSKQGFSNEFTKRPGVSEILAYKASDKKSLARLRRLIRDIRQRKFDLMVIAYRNQKGLSSLARILVYHWMKGGNCTFLVYDNGIFMKFSPARYFLFSLLFILHPLLIVITPLAAMCYLSFSGINKIFRKKK
jgi:ADP-heptose:LPS heptosyltransferase